MPNWVTTRFTIEGKDAKKVLSIIWKCATRKQGLFKTFLGEPETFRKYDTTNYTFSKLVKMRNKKGITEIEDQMNGKTLPLTDEIILEYDKACKYQKRKYGVVGWYDYHCKYWGTKWDADNIDIVSNNVSFMTAWSFPVPFFEHLAKKYDIAIYDGEFDEEGNFYGDFEIVNGELLYNTYDGCREDEDEEEYEEEAN